MSDTAVRSLYNKNNVYICFYTQDTGIKICLKMTFDRVRLFIFWRKHYVVKYDNFV